MPIAPSESTPGFRGPPRRELFASAGAEFHLLLQEHVPRWRTNPSAILAPSSGRKTLGTMCRIPVRPFDYVMKAGQPVPARRPLSGMRTMRRLKCVSVAVVFSSLALSVKAQDSKSEDQSAYK